MRLCRRGEEGAAPSDRDQGSPRRLRRGAIGVDRSRGRLSLMQAAEHGIRLRRVAMPNASPAMIRGLAEVVERELAGR